MRMYNKVLQKDATVFKTPLVDIRIVDESERTITFDIVDSFDPKHAEYLREIEGYIMPAKNNYDEKIIQIATKNLEIAKKYYVKTSVPIKRRDSDEHLFTYGLSTADQTFAISFPDPNDEKKWFLRDNRDKMTWYDFNEEATSGTKAVCFTLIDREKEYIYIAAAWIWDIFEHMQSYESAADIFTWII